MRISFGNWLLHILFYLNKKWSLQSTGKWIPQPLVFNCQSHLPMTYPASTHEALTIESWQYNHSTMLWRKYNKKEASLEDREDDPFTRLALHIALGDPNTTCKKLQTNRTDSAQDNGAYLMDFMLGTWNVRGIGSELKKSKSDIAFTLKTKKTSKGTLDVGPYKMVYSGVPTEKWASQMVILVKKELKNKLLQYQWISTWIVKLRFKFLKITLTTIGVYTPVEGQDDETNDFYGEMQDAIQKVNKREYLIIAQDLNARVGNQSLMEVLVWKENKQEWINTHKFLTVS